MNLTLELDSNQYKDLTRYCELNKFIPEEIVKKSYLEGFMIEKYGLLGNTGGVQEKEVIKEVVVEKRVEIPVEVIKEVVKVEYVEVPVEKVVTVEKPVERLVEVIKEVPVERVVEKIVEVTVDRDMATPPSSPLFQKIDLTAGRVLTITYSKAVANAGDVLGAVKAAGYGIADVSTREPALEDVFLNLTRAA